jgi:glucosamine-6-phosphate deaminase
MTPEIHARDQWATVVADDLAARLADPAGQRICLPTGSTPAPAYRLLPAALHALRADAGAATVVLLDEYLGLAPDDPARCDRQLRTQLIDRLDPAPRFVPIPVDDRTPDEAAAALDAAAAEGLDLVVLGLGRNGHVGMNEPGSGPDSPTRAAPIQAATLRTAVEDYGAAGVPTGGVTLGLDRILGADEVWLLVTGTAKAAVLAQLLGGPMSADLPASLLRDHPGLRVIADEAAAGHM